MLVPYGGTTSMRIYFTNVQDLLIIVIIITKPETNFKVEDVVHLLNTLKMQFYISCCTFKISRIVLYFKTFRFASKQHY